ncbi:MAG: histidine--tRNA ligase [Actinomycetes bacterium]
MPKFQTSPGMRDILPPESARWRRFVGTFSDAVTAAGYGQIIPPLLEDIGVFHRVGEATDVVTKEMYDFVDKGDRHIALRPEQTASVCRAFVQHGPTTPWKVWYAGPNFRYERPQRGRFRQFDQVGVEVLGVEDPYLDIEVICLAWNFFAQLGLQQVALHINSLGEPSDRERYMQALQEYFSANLETLSAASQVTLAKNPLRVLDSKRPEDQELISGAPRISDFYSPQAKAHFDTVQEGLSELGIAFVINEKLVRGLDYYRHTTFEFVGGTLESAQNALGGGGRYDGLVEALGGPSTAGVGFAIGLDRTLLACDDEGVFAPTPEDVSVFVVDITGGKEAMLITQGLRSAGVSADRAFEGRSIKSQMKLADRSGATVAIIIGPDEVAAATAVIRPLRSDREQYIVSRKDLLPSITKELS